MNRSSLISLFVFALATSSLACTSSSSEGEDGSAGTENAINGTTPANAKTCFFDTTQSAPNPLGDRTIVTLLKTEDGTILRYEALPQPVFGLPEGTLATVGIRRDLLLHGVSSLDAARKALRARDGKLWSQIWDDAEAPITFAQWEKTITCTKEEFDPEVGGPIDAEMCMYNPESDHPNVLGMRTYVTLFQAGGNTEARYETFPSNVPGTSNATIETVRAVTIENLQRQDAMEKLRTEAFTPAVTALTGGPMSPADVGEMFDTFVCP